MVEGGRGESSLLALALAECEVNKVFGPCQVCGSHCWSVRLLATPRPHTSSSSIVPSSNRHTLLHFSPVIVLLELCLSTLLSDFHLQAYQSLFSLSGYHALCMSLHSSMCLFNEGATHRHEYSILTSSSSVLLDGTIYSKTFSLFQLEIRRQAV